MTADHTLAALAGFAARTRADDLPEEVVRRASGIVVDTLGCLVAGRGCRAVEAGRGLLSEAGRSDWGTVVGRSDGSPPELAAFLNTAMIRYVDYNDHLAAGHPSDMIGALLALVRRPDRPASGSDLLTALVVAYEVHARLVLKMRANQTIDRTYSIAMGATAGVCNLLRLSEQVTREAIAMAATAGVALRASRAGALSDFKGAASAIAAKEAVFLALVAEQGLTGPESPFEGRHGLRELFAGEQGPLEIDPFDDWRVLETSTKYWPVAYGIQPAIWTGIALRELVDADDVERVVLHAAPFGWFESGSEPAKWDPRTRESADHSMPYAFARALRHGRVDSDAFEPSQFRDPTTLALMQRITVEPDWERGPKISDIVGVRAELTTKDGTVHVVNVDEPPGHHRNPMSHADITDKAHRLIAPALGDRTDAALDQAWRVADAETLEPLLEAFLF